MSTPLRAMRSPEKGLTRRVRPFFHGSTLAALLAARELERGDSGSPGSEDQVRSEVLLRVPERAVVRRVDAQVAVVAPASLDLRLGTGAGPGDLLRLRHLAERIARL